MEKEECKTFPTNAAKNHPKRKVTDTIHFEISLHLNEVKKKLLRRHVYIKTNPNFLFL